MLQMEHDRAQKKIQETYTKAENLERLKEQNNQRFLLKIQEKERREQAQKITENGKTFAEVRKDQLEHIK